MKMNYYKKPFLFIWPLVYLICIAPWYAFGKIIIKLDLKYDINLEVYALSIFAVLYIGQVIGNLKASKLTDEQRFELLNKMMLGQGKVLSLLFSIKGAIILLTFIAILIIAIFEKWL